jgi:hypothetical protein
VDSYEKIGYTLLGIVAALYILAMIVGMVAVFPYGLVGLIVITAIGVLFIKVLKERLQNKEDDYYSKKVDK